MQLERQLIDKKGLKQIGVPYSFAHIAHLEAAGLFPKRIQLGQCRVAWRYQAVLDWIAGREARSTLTKARTP